MKKRNKKNKKINLNQKSFFFEDYLETNLKYKKKNLFLISDDRIYLLFFFFVSLIFIFAMKIIIVSLQSNYISNEKNNLSYFKPFRNDIVDRNGELLSRNIQSFHAAIRSDLIKDKKNLLVKIKIIFPELNSEKILNKINNKNYFYLKKRLTEDEKNKLWALGEKGILFEPYQSRIYPQGGLFSHILGQIDNDNYGISGVEKYFDEDLKKDTKSHNPLQLTLDTNLQYIIKNEINKSIDIFKAEGGAGLLMNAENGEVLSLVSLPDYNINKRNNIEDKNYTNKITKSIFELGSIFKTFTIALALDNKIVEPKTLIKNIPNKINCSKYTISDIKKFPNNLTVEDIVIRSSNIGTIMIARKIGKEKYQNFLNNLNLTSKIKFELDEIGVPLDFRWNKCKLETVSYGHGITTTPLQAAAGYASLINGGYLVNPTLYKNKKIDTKKIRVVSEKTSSEIRKILRKVVTEKEGTASLANIYGYEVSGKTGTSQYYENENKNINTFISFFSSNKKKYILLVILDDPQIASDLVYNYRGFKIKGTRNEAGWNVVYTSGKIIEKIGPILAINNNDFTYSHVVKKPN